MLLIISKFLFADAFATFQLGFLVPCLNVNEFRTAQISFLNILAVTLGLNPSVLSIWSIQDPSATMPNRRLLSIPAPLPGVSATLLVSSEYDQDVALIRGQLDADALSAALRGIGVPCSAYIQFGPSPLVREAPPAIVPIEEEPFDLNDMASVPTGGRILSDGPQGSPYAAAWFHIEPSGGNLTGGTSVTVHGIFFDTLAPANGYRCRFAAPGGLSVLSAPRVPISATQAVFVLPQWPYPAQRTTDTLLLASGLAHDTIPHEGPGGDAFEFEPYWLCAAPLRGPAAGGTAVTVAAVGLDPDANYTCLFLAVDSFQRAASPPVSPDPSPGNAGTVVCSAPPWPYPPDAALLVLARLIAGNATEAVDYAGCPSRRVLTLPVPDQRARVAQYVAPSPQCAPVVFHFDGEYDPAHTLFRPMRGAGGAPPPATTGTLRYDTGGAVTTEAQRSSSGPHSRSRPASTCAGSRRSRRWSGRRRRPGRCRRWTSPTRPSRRTPPACGLPGPPRS